MDIFDLIGPVMVGPSSSHTAGAVRIGLVTRKLLGEDVKDAKIELHGSFAATAVGHGTDRALIAGLLGMQTDDERIPESFDHARDAGLTFSFSNCNLRDAHPNSVRLTVKGVNGAQTCVVAASVGGGRISVRELSGMPLQFAAEYPTIIIQNDDQPGSVADVSRVLAEENINIGTFQVNRSARGGDAIMVIECDAPIEPHIVEHIRTLSCIRKAVCINPD